MNRDALVSILIDDEALRLKPYDDATGKELKPGDTLKGNITIGIGRNLSGVGISKSEAFMLNCADIDKAETQLDNALPWWRSMSERRQIVILSMVFNMGINKVLGFIRTLSFMKQGDYNAAADGMEASLWAKQVGNRAKRLIDMMRKG
jgi:lysozyme